MKKLANWEKVVLLAYLKDQGLPSWAEEDNFYKLPMFLCNMTKQQAKRAVATAEFYKGMINRVTPKRKEKNRSFSK